MQVIREYCHQMARKVDGEIVEKKSPLKDAEISQLDLDCAYHLLIGTNQTRLKHNEALTDFFDCKMKIYVSARNSDNENYDRGYAKALCIRDELVKSANVADNDYINSVLPVSVTPSNAPGNEKVFIFEININVSVTYDLLGSE